MKKVLLTIGVVTFLLSGLPLSRADDSSDLKNESLIHYYYKDKNGKDQREIYMTEEDMPPEVREEPKECWIDYNEFMRCHPLKKKGE